jgi:hypothetical protein
MSTTKKTRLTIPADFVVERRMGERSSFPIANLVPPIEWMRFCRECDKEVRFIADRVCLTGLLGECSVCGDERIAPFTRANSEVA